MRTVGRKASGTPSGKESSWWDDEDNINMLIVIFLCVFVLSLSIYWGVNWSGQPPQLNWTCAEWDEINITQEVYHFRIFCNGTLDNEFWTNSFELGLRESSESRKYCYQWTKNVSYEYESQQEVTGQKQVCTRQAAYRDGAPEECNEKYNVTGFHCVELGCKKDFMTEGFCDYYDRVCIKSAIYREVRA